jgi:hypothetical protein
VDRCEWRSAIYWISSLLACLCAWGWWRCPCAARDVCSTCSILPIVFIRRDRRSLADIKLLGIARMILYSASKRKKIPLSFYLTPQRIRQPVGSVGGPPRSKTLLLSFPRTRPSPPSSFAIARAPGAQTFWIFTTDIFARPAKSSYTRFAMTSWRTIALMWSQSSWFEEESPREMRATLKWLIGPMELGQICKTACERW